MASNCLNSDSLFSTPHVNGKKSDPLKFSDPLSFGGSDPLRFSDPLSFGVTEKTRSDPLGLGGEEAAGGETTETESRHSDDDFGDEASAPPADYLERVQVGEAGPPPHSHYLNFSTAHPQMS